MDANVHSIESFGTVDGPGTRFVIFLKGCNLRCLYCHNPDTWNPNGGQKYTIDQLFEKYEGVKEFVTGGITVSGGEPLMQIDFLIEFFKRCQEKNIHTCLDTSGGTFNPYNSGRMKKFDELIKHVDLVLLDLKHIDDEEHIKLTSVSNVPILAFANYLSDNNVNVWIRHVVIPTITLDDKYLFKLGLFIKNLKNVKGLEALPYHTMALNKYETMKMTYPLDGVRPCTEEEALRARNIILLGMKGKI